MLGVPGRVREKQMRSVDGAQEACAVLTGATGKSFELSRGMLGPSGTLGPGPLWLPCRGLRPLPLLFQVMRGQNPPV